MSLRDLFSIILSNLLRMRFRTVLTVLGVLIGTSAVILMVSLGVGLQRQAFEQMGLQFGEATQLSVYPAGTMGPLGPGMASPREPKGKIKLDNKGLNLLKSLDNVEAVMPEIELFAMDIRYKRYHAPGFPVAGIESKFLKKFDFKVKKGRLVMSSKSVLLGTQVPRNFFTASSQKRARGLDLVGERISLSFQRAPEGGGEFMMTSPRTKEVKFKVAGILQKKGGDRDFRIFIPFKKAERIQRQVEGKRIKEYQTVKIKVDSPNNVKTVEKKIEKLGFNVSSLEDILRGVNQVFLLIQAILGGIGSVALIVASLGIANTMTMAIYERTREIGIMKAVGASNNDIMRIFLSEAGAIGFIGGLFGILFGFGGAKLINAALLLYYAESMQDFKGGILYTPLWLLTFGLLFATAIGLISGIYPSLRAARLSPLSALRHE